MMKSGLGVTVAGVAMVLFAIGAGWLALRLVRGNRAAIVATLPVQPEQSFAAPAGELVVSLEVPRLSTDFQNWELELTEASTQRQQRMKWAGPRTSGTVKGFSTIKVPIGRLVLSAPEQLTFRLRGLAPNSDPSATHIVLARPYLARIAIHVVGIVVCGVAMLLSVIWGLWQLGVVKSG